MAIDNFIPQIWSGRILENLNKQHVFAARLNRDYEGEIKILVTLCELTVWVQLLLRTTQRTGLLTILKLCKVPIWFLK